MNNFDHRLLLFKFAEENIPNNKFEVFKNYELSSDKYITGELKILNSKNELKWRIRPWQSADESKDNMNKYLVTFYEYLDTDPKVYYHEEEMSKYHINDDTKQPLKKIDGYGFGANKIEELVYLLSLFFQSRFFISSQFTEFNKIDDKEHVPQLNKYFHSKYSNTLPEYCNFFNHFGPFLEKIKNINENKQRSVIYSAYFYNKALKSLDVDSATMLTNLVFSIESLLENTKNKELKDKVKKILTKDFTTEQRDLILNLINNSGINKAFVNFIVKYSDGWTKFKNERFFINTIDSIDEIYKIDKVMERVYNTRSNYLHRGIPPFIERYMNIPDNQPHFSINISSIHQDITYTEEEKLPFLYILEDIIRYCILKYIDTIVK